MQSSNFEDFTTVKAGKLLPQYFPRAFHVSFSFSVSVCFGLPCRLSWNQMIEHRSCHLTKTGNSITHDLTTAGKVDRGCLCDNWKSSFLPRTFNWRTFSRRVTAHQVSKKSKIDQSKLEKQLVSDCKTNYMGGLRLVMKVLFIMIFFHNEKVIFRYVFSL